MSTKWQWEQIGFWKTYIFLLRAGDSLRYFHIAFMTFPTVHLDDLIPAFRLLWTACSLQVPMSISGENSSVSLFSAISFKNFKFKLGSSEEICKKLFLSSSLIPDMRASWTSVAVAPLRNKESKYLISTFLSSSFQNLIRMSICPL